MIRYRENLDLYLKMSRKELQQLCKKHRLPANRNHAQLAKSLASLFKKRNARSSASVEKTVNPIDGSSRKSFVSEPEATRTINPLEELTRGECRRLVRQIGNQIEVIGHMVNPTSEKPETAINALCPSCPANHRGTEGFGSSNSEHCDICVAADSQEITRSKLLGLECEEAGIRNGSGKFLEPRNAGQKLIQDAATNSRTCNTVPVPCEHNRPHEYSTESGFVSADEISTRSPSLQFFVMSEGGINLYVDLNSRPLEWISSLKDEVCVHQNAEHHESRTLLKHISDSPEVDDHMKISPSVDTAMNLQGIGVEQNIGCTNSSLSSVVSENCNSEAYPPDTTVVTSGSSALTSGSVPAGLSGCLEENQVVSSSCATYSVQNHLASDIASCPQEGILLIQDSVNASLVMVNSNVSLPDASMKSIANKDDGAITPATIDGSTPKTPCADFVDVEDNALSNTLNHIPDKNSLPMSKEIGESVDTSHSGHLKDHNGACESSFAQCMNELPDKESPHGGLSSSCQLGQMLLDGPMADAQSEVGVADGLFYQQACGSCGTLVPEDPMSMFQDESGQKTPMRVKDASECSRVQTSDNNSKRSNNLEFPEELHVKKQHVCGENMSGTIMNLSSTKNSAKEVVPDTIVLPRRSTRLVAK